MEAVISIVGSILGSLAGKAAEYTVDPIAQQLSYLFKPKSKFQNFRDQLQKLKDARERVQQKVNEAKRNGEKIFNDVDRWLTDVNGKISEEAALQFQEDEEKAKKRCFVVLCPNFKSRYQLSRKAEKEANTIAQLLEQNGKFDLVCYPAAPEGVATRPVKDYEGFESRTGAFNAVMEALKDSNLSIIGVYGMGGVGKTTLVKQVARQAKEENLFDEVVMATVTQSLDIKKIQDQIAEQLGDKKLEKESDSGRAEQIRNRLKNREKVLVILDDIWGKLDLEAVGIPYGAEHQGCKILLTSRELNALFLMDSPQNIAMEVLKEDEAWELFMKTAGDIVLRPDLHCIANGMAKKCAGLPIAIVTVGNGVKNKKNVHEWRSALQELRRPSKINFRGIPADAYSAIELSYKFLEDAERQPTFLLCSIMGHDAVIEDLLIYGKGLGIFHGVDSIQEARDKVLTLVSNLKASCLLLDGSTPKYSNDVRERFDMHDVVRDVAISISSRDQHWLALGREEVFKEWSDEERMRRCNLISLRDAKVSELPDELECPNLTFFSMVSEGSSLKIPDNFFKGMQRLKVLDFAKMHFSSLPLSISSLKNLHTLCFSWCTLEDIAIIGELKNLEILNLRGSTTATLPREIGQLTKLKLLDLSCCDNLKVISPNVLSSLSRLEELYLYGSFDRWGVEVEGHDNPRSNASLVELNHLSHLVTLEVHIPNQQAIPKDNLFFGKLERYKISIGESWNWYHNKLETSRMLKVQLDESINLYDVVKMLLKIENLCLNGVKNVENMLHDPNNEGFPHLKHLSIKNVSEIKYVNNSMKLVSCIAFPLLVSLTLEELINLENICYGQLKAGSFSQLKTMKVRGCHTLKNLFSVSVARGLCQLQEIYVRNCRNMAKIVVADEKEGNIGEIEENGILEFPQLRTLKLWSLPELKIFYSAEERVSSSRQEGIQSTIDASSDVVTPFFNQKIAFPSIEELVLSYCNNLKYVFTSSSVKSFVELKTLKIECCNKIEEVISVTQGLVEEERVVFPKLEHLNLDHLLKLKRFCCGSPIEFPSPKKVTIWSCNVSSISMDHNLRIQYLFNQKVAFPAIEVLELYKCNNLKYVFTSSTVKSFVQLKTLQIRSCNKIEEVISVTQGLVEEERVVFPKLEHLQLSYLPNLKRFCCVSPIEFPSLKKLQISYCDVLSSIFHCDCTSSVGKSSSISMDHNLRTQYLFNHKVALPMLEHLEIWGLKNLERLWPNQLADESYPKLIQLELGGCDKLLNVFPLSMSRRLQRLNKLSIQNCQLLEEIFEPQQDHSSFIEPLSPKLIQSFEFPQVTNLELWGLPKLKGFYHEMHSTHWSSLKHMEVLGCDKVEILFASHEKMEKSQQDVSIQQPLFWVNKFTFPNLELLDLGPNDGMKEIWHACGQQQLVTDYLCKLKDVQVCHIPKKFAIIPLYFLQLLSLPNLETLEISYVDCKEIFPSEGVGGEEMPASAWVVLSRVTELRLTHLSELMHLWNEKEGFQNLRILEVEDCPKLKNYLVPSSVSFQNLVTLLVQKCGGITKLITHSTAKTLVQLKQMSITDCYGMKEIIEGSGDDEDDMKIVISFPLLNSLKLRNLRELESFCSSENYCFAFPSLEKVKVKDCPKMKMFSQGDSNTPMLQCVRFWEKGKEHRSWEGNLNSTIQQEFKEENEDENSDEDEEEENSDEDEEDQDNPSTSNTKNPIEEVHNSVEDQGNRSTSNTQ
ncbi:hypothetical protein REPUB_Repub16aG0091400 [Reevesia pubescens]